LYWAQNRSTCNFWRTMYVTSLNVWYPAYRLRRRDITIDCLESAALPANPHRVRERIQSLEPELLLYKRNLKRLRMWSQPVYKIHSQSLGLWTMTIVRNFK
jgi:hypothetical protein